MIAAPTAHPRRSIHYWKCDRPAAFHGTTERADDAEIAAPLEHALREHFPGKNLALRAAGGQGNHRTFFAALADAELFVRVEDGPERDDYMEVETRVLGEVRALGIPAPRVFAVDASRQRVPFAWQVMERIAAPDLNEHHKRGHLDLPRVATEIGAAVACWQELTRPGFGPFDPEVLRRENRLCGFHGSYAEYFHLHLDRHLHFLDERGFLPAPEASEIAREIAQHHPLLTLATGCLVHKDLALWNILGSDTRIAAFIDWDDAIAGDPLDDLSLLGCFYDGSILARALAGYATVRPLPAEHRRRFWLHLLRNMLVKAVIRVGAGYFDRTDGFYLIGTGSSGADLRAFTRARLAAALRGLREDQPIETL
jgi:aminoglycoside phosphotransferase (APT) family kinase protein